MPKVKISRRLGTVVFGYLAALWASGCGGADKALILFDVKVAADIPDFKTLSFSNPDDPSVPARSVDGPSHRPEFNFGYYVSNPKGTLTVVAAAIRGDGCIVGEGRSTISGVTAGKQLQGGVLAVAKLAAIRCTSGDGGQDRGDVPVDVPQTPDGDGSDGVAGETDDGGPGKRPNGERCAENAECSFGFCVDGVCCESACSGQCSSCNEPDGGAGKCLIVTGTPRAPRSPCGGTAPCNARCDGTDATACKYPGSSVQCAAGSCLNGSIKTLTTCDGAGACTAAMTLTCPSSLCADTTKCSGGCSASLPCESGKYCDATGVCLPTKTNGDSCQGDAECTSTFCADSVCCSNSCKGQCEACREPTKVGTCITVSGAPRGTRPGCAGSQASCAGRCDGATATACSYPGDSTVCTAATCSGTSSVVSASVCNGGGVCTSATTTPCGDGNYCSAAACVPQGANGSACQSGFQCRSGNCTGGTCCAGGQTGCSGICKNLATDNANCGACGKPCPGGSCSNGSLTSPTTCNGSGVCSTATTAPCPSNQCADNTKCSGACTSGASCGAGKYCDAAGACQPTKTNGMSCQSDSECGSAHCVDGVCCASICNGQCQACNEPQMAGSCVTVTGVPRGSRSACAGTRATCVGQCDGMSANACTYPGSSAICTPATCSGSFSFVSASVCDSGGSCTGTATNTCGTGTYCNGGACVSQVGNGSTCSSAAQCQSGNCTGGVCCVSGQTGCHGVCKNLATDSANCGACDKTCPGSSCANGTLTSATSCNGAGACTTPTTSMCPNQCADSTKCSGGCSAGNPCLSGKYCDQAGVCQPTKGNGVSCQSGTECTTGFCVDGVCCSSMCNGQCQACHEPSNAGTCVTVSGVPRGSRSPCTGAQTTCGGQCGGTGASATACVYPSGTTCAAATCSGSFSLVNASTCNGGGACVGGGTSMCPGGNYCTNGACTPQFGNGSACQIAAQCQSGNCTNGMCCGSGQTNCSGVCRSLASDSANCGTCGHQCPGVTCANGSLSSATTCNGAGTCTTPTVTACPSNQCANSTKCSYCPTTTGISAADFCAEYATVCMFGGASHYVDMADCITKYNTGNDTNRSCRASDLCFSRSSGGAGCAQVAGPAPCA